MTTSVTAILESIVLVVVMFVMPAQSIAADTNPMPFGRAAIPLVHTRWLVKDGAPPGMADIAQTPDGWIWLSSRVGLFRFDGVSFTRYQLPPGQTMANNTTRIGVLSDGTLWVSARFGGLYFIKDNTLRIFKAGENNFPRGAMGDVLRDSAGKIWVASWPGLFSLEPGETNWRKMNAEVGLPETPINDLLLDKNGMMWALAPKSIYARRKGENRFEKISDKIGWGRLGETPDGGVWSTDMGGNGVRRLWTERNNPKYDILKQKEFNAFNFLIDRHGNFWFPKNNGMIRVEFDKKAPSIQGYTTQQGLSGITVNAVFEDREGNIWVLTDSGVDQFRVSRMSLLSLPPIFGEGQALLAGQDGDLWADYNYRRNVDSSPEPFAPKPQQKNLINVLYRDPHGVVWCADLEGLWKLEGLKRVKVTLPPEIKKLQSFVIHALAMDAEDGLWLSLDFETWRLKGGVWQKYGNISELKDVAVLSMASGADKTLLFGSISSNIFILQDGKINKFGPAQGLDIGTVMQIIPYAKGVYVGGENGMAFFDGHRVTRIKGENDETFPGITGLVMMPDSSLWANSGVGLISISASELAKVMHNPKYLVRFHRFDENDGLIGTAPPLGPIPSMVRTSENDLIISTTSGAFRFNPARSKINKVAPPVEITRVTASGKTHVPTSKLTLDSAPDSVKIDYTALSFTLPHRVNFRYMLDTVDQQWQDAGVRRSAFYTKLPPGIYNFKVMAANDDGVWNNTSAQVTFEIPPTLTQTGWFKLILLMATLLFGWLLHRLRLHIALRRLAATFEARTAERERIARDLHDTLLQSVQGLILIFSGIVKRIPNGEPLKGRMKDALDFAAEVMDEGRDKVQGLRTVVAEHNELTVILEDFGRRMADQYMASFTMQILGRARPLHTSVHDELLMIGREAIRNAFAHANPSEINVELMYSEQGVELSVKDDGCGIDSDLQMGRPDHWGIQGMHERAVQLGASLELSSAKDQGTTWRLRIAARLAYFETDNRGSVARDRKTNRRENSSN